MRVVDLFCGAGGMSCGFSMEGFEIVLGVDISPVAIRTFRKNHPEAEVICEDIRELSDFPKVDVVIGGPPCPNFSRANYWGKNPELGLELVNEFLRCVKLINPKYWIMENVPQIVEYINLHDFQTIQILNASDYGVPQNRKRCFAGVYVVPRKTHHSPATVGESLDGLEENEVVRFFSDFAVSQALISKETHKTKGHGFGYKIIKLDKPSPTITSHLSRNSMSDLVFYEKGRYRRPTVKECMRLQTFPDDYRFFGNKKEKYIQIGRAVPPLLAKALARALRVGRKRLLDVFN